MSKLVTILTNSSIIINRAAQILNNNNIYTTIIDHTESARLAGFGTSQDNVDLLVNAADLEKAKQILDKTGDFY